MVFKELCLAFHGKLLHREERFKKGKESKLTGEISPRLTNQPVMLMGIQNGDLYQKLSNHISIASFFQGNERLAMVFAEIKTQPSGFHDSTSLCFIQTIGSGSSPDSWPFLPGYLYQNIHALFVLKFHTHVMVLSLVHFVFLDLLRRVTTNI